MSIFSVTGHLLRISVLSLLLFFSGGLLAQSSPPASPPADWGPISINLENVPYPYPVHFLNRNLHGQDVRIAYMDVAPAGAANGQTVVMLHGASYYGWYWEQSIQALTAAGFRVITVDRLGWGRSSKPIIPYSAALHSSNTRAIIDHLGIEQVAIVGHSMGGKLASLFAYTYPDITTHLVMVNPIGIGGNTSPRPWRDASAGDVEPDLQRHYQSNLRQEQRRVVDWQPQFLEHVRIRYGLALSGEYPRLNLVRSLNGGVLEDPIAAYFPLIETRALLLAGAEDGPDYPAQSTAAVNLLPNGTLHLIENAGHNPHLEAPEIFNRELIRFLLTPPDQEISTGE